MINYLFINNYNIECICTQYLQSNQFSFWMLGTAQLQWVLRLLQKIMLKTNSIHFIFVILLPFLDQLIFISLLLVFEDYWPSMINCWIFFHSILSFSLFLFSPAHYTSLISLSKHGGYQHCSSRDWMQVLYPRMLLHIFEARILTKLFYARL